MSAQLLKQGEGRGGTGVKGGPCPGVPARQLFCMMLSMMGPDSTLPLQVRSMAKQLEYSVVANKRSPKPTALTFCSWKGEAGRRGRRGLLLHCCCC